MNPPSNGDRATRSARDLLVFYRDAGVDAVLVEKPIDHLADAPEALPAAQSVTAAESAPGAGIGSAPVRSPEPQHRQPLPSASAKGMPKALASPLPAEAAVMSAREAAKTAQSLDELRALLAGFAGCPLSATATQLVFADGNPHARVMFVGEAPGNEEDISGLPFVGRSGKLLDRMMAAIRLNRTKAYIANIVPWRPPGNRTPTPQETAICLPFIRRQIELADPDVLVCLGQPSSAALLATKEGITRTRGRWFTYDTGSREIRALATFHPAFLLRSPLQKRLAWRDFLALKKALGG